MDIVENEVVGYLNPENAEFEDGLQGLIAFGRVTGTHSRMFPAFVAEFQIQGSSPSPRFPDIHRSIPCAPRSVILSKLIND